MLIVVLLMLAAALEAQVASSTLQGEVRDPSSAVVPGAVVAARNERNGFTRSVLSGARGAYRMDELPPGAYTVTVEKPGFRRARASGAVLSVNQTARLDFTLEVGTERESVSVSAQVSPVDSSGASAGYTLGGATIDALPLAERNPIALVTLGPGAIPRHLGGFAHDVVNDIQEGPRGSVALNPPINGSRSTMNAYLFDGANDTDRNTYAIAVTPPLEAISEFRIQAALPSAEFAQAGGGVVDLVSRSGGQQFHGSAFELFRNEGLDAHNYFDDKTRPRPIFRQNQFGGSLGGPLPLPATFFFATYEGLRGKQAQASLVLVPDAALRGGDFAGRNPLADPLDGRRPFPNNAIPAGRIDPIARRFLDEFEPLPNRADPSANYLDATPAERTEDSVSSRVDHQFGTNHWLFGRYTINDGRDRVTATFPELPTSERLRAQQALLAHTFARGAWVNDARLSFTRLRLFDVPLSAFHTNVAQQLGITNPPTDPFTFGLPYFLVTNFSLVTDSPTLPQVQRDNLWHFSDGVSLQRGRHTWKLGFDALRSQVNYLQTQYARGQYTFTGAFTADPAAAATGDAFADFLLGLPQVTSRTVGPTQAYLRQNSYAGYAEDQWRATAALTLNFGLRYEYAAPMSEARNSLLNLAYPTAGPPQLMRVAAALRPDRNNFAPRAGLALRLPGARETVFRAGYGLYYSPEIAVETYDLILNGTHTERNQTDGGAAPVLTTANGFPQTASTGFPSYFGLASGARMPYVQQWTASLQRELPFGVLGEAAYIASKGTKLGRFRRFNIPPAPGPGELQSRRPFPELGTIIQRQHISNSSYQSLQLKAEKRTGALSLLASFVWSKSIDDADTVIPGLFDSFGAQNEQNLRLERGLSFFNVGRRVSAGFVYNLPRVSRVLSGWALSGIATLQDGTPLNPVYFATDFANTGTPNRPDVVPGQSIALPRGQRTVEHFFNTSALTAPQPFHFGNAGRDIIPGPGNNVFDFALHRKFPIREHGALEFRAEAFNAFNHPNWGVPGEYPDFGPFFGRVFVTGPPRRLQVGLRFEY